MTCPDYTPGPKIGKDGLICGSYMMNGGCKKPKYFMCILWEAKKKAAEKKEEFENMR